MVGQKVSCNFGWTLGGPYIPGKRSSLSTVSIWEQEVGCGCSRSGVVVSSGLEQSITDWLAYTPQTLVSHSPRGWKSELKIRFW